MNALEQIRQQGFTLRAVDDDGLYIEPIDRLSDRQRLWLINNKPLIRHQLLTERWQWFLSLATEHGVHPLVVNAEFPADHDRLDVIGSTKQTDEELRQRMEALCGNAKVRQRQHDYDNGDWLPVDDASCELVGSLATISSSVNEDLVNPSPKNKPHSHSKQRQCGRCEYYSFNPTTGSTGLGWCNARTEVTMSLPSRLIECDYYHRRKTNHEQG